ncbi:hypothetical protein C9I28_10760 [Pseudoduganella armeniaca]|uniref:Uncharacterized protein n=1 Tax=Pseudoduganella armeniaca TaxID=2072590 RepID=A0A2R4C928_9BURK|nr:hypothetical protein C9I28_10760 [Pseudoduganella armeniaca]
MSWHHANVSDNNFYYASDSFIANETYISSSIRPTYAKIAGPAQLPVTQYAVLEPSTKLDGLFLIINRAISLIIMLA